MSNKRKSSTPSTPFSKRIRRAQNLPVAARSRSNVVTRSLVRKQLLGLAETKRFVGVPAYSGGNPTSNTYYWCNPLYWLTSGAADTQRIGDEIFITKIDIWGAVQSSTAFVGGLGMRLLVLATDQENHDGTVSLGPMSASLLTDPRLSTSTGMTSTPVDTSLYTVLSDTYVRLDGAKPSTTTEGKRYGVSVPVNRKFQFKSTTSGYEKYRNIYICTSFDLSSGGTVATWGTSDIGYAVYFKDI